MMFPGRNRELIKVLYSTIGILTLFRQLHLRAGTILAWLLLIVVCYMIGLQEAPTPRIRSFHRRLNGSGKVESESHQILTRFVPRSRYDFIDFSRHHAIDHMHTFMCTTAKCGHGERMSSDGSGASHVCVKANSGNRYRQIIPVMQSVIVFVPSVKPALIITRS